VLFFFQKSLIELPVRLFITRDLVPDGYLVQQAQKAGWLLEGFSLLEFEGLYRYEASRLPPDGSLLFFYSKNGAKFFFEELLKHRNLNRTWQYGCMGQQTADFLSDNYGAVAQIIVATGREALAAEQLLGYSGDLYFFRAETSQKTIQKLLPPTRASEDWVVYQNRKKTTLPSIPPSEVYVLTSPLNAEAIWPSISHLNPLCLAIGHTTLKYLTTHCQNGRFEVAETPSESSLFKKIKFLVENK
jgi:uroporphyrinogen-III synthase